MTKVQDVVRSLDGLGSQVAVNADLVDWGSVPDGSVTNWALALELHHDAHKEHQHRQVASQTASGSALSVGAVALACLVAARLLDSSLSADFVLATVVVHQVLRASWLFWQMYRTRKLVRSAYAQVADLTHQLAQDYPADGDQ